MKRMLGWIALPAAVFVLSATGGRTAAGQEPAGAPSLVITAFGGKAVEYKAPRTPWGDPDLQGAWSSDDMENVPMAAGGRGGRGGGAPPAGPQPLYLDDAAFQARVEQ